MTESSYQNQNHNEFSYINQFFNFAYLELREPVSDTLNEKIKIENQQNNLDIIKKENNDNYPTFSPINKNTEFYRISQDDFINGKFNDLDYSEYFQHLNENNTKCELTRQIYEDNNNDIDNIVNIYNDYKENNDMTSYEYYYKENNDMAKENEEKINDESDNSEETNDEDYNLEETSDEDYNSESSEEDDNYNSIETYENCDINKKKNMLDITHLLEMRQIDAAKILGIHKSALSKKFSKAVFGQGRRWPHRKLKKIESNLKKLSELKNGIDHKKYKKKLLIQRKKLLRTVIINHKFK